MREQLVPISEIKDVAMWSSRPADKRKPPETSTVFLRPGAVDAIEVKDGYCTLLAGGKWFHVSETLAELQDLQLVAVALT